MTGEKDELGGKICPSVCPTQTPTRTNLGLNLNFSGEKATTLSKIWRDRLCSWSNILKQATAFFSVFFFSSPFMFFVLVESRCPSTLLNNVAK